MYRLLRPLLFLFDPEAIHHFTFSLLHLVSKFPGVKGILSRLFLIQDPRLEKKLLGLTFKNPIGLAAGFDKDAKLIEELACFGFGFIEIGTVTPKPQTGNERPRLFRLSSDEALVNRMGFNNEGVLATAERLKKRSTKEPSGKSRLLVGGNIGKNKATPNEKAFEDYNYCFEVLYPYVDYFVVNVSSPNTPNLRELQDKNPLKKLLNQVKELNNAKDSPKPVLLKIAPDLTVGQLDDVIEILKETKTDGVIATNTTIARDGLVTSGSVLATIGAGGLSGRPLGRKSDEVIAYLRKGLGKDYPIIGVGGVLTVEDALVKMKAGADLIQIYTGFIYNGPGFVKSINQAILEQMALGKREEVEG